MIFDKNPDSITCPYTEHRKLCRKLRNNCPKWVKLHNEQVKLDEWGCADTFQPILQVEQSLRIERLQKEINVLRNTIVEVVSNSSAPVVLYSKLTEEGEREEQRKIG
jgi:hypothetical protein